jgi:hypothetical protein
VLEAVCDGARRAARRSRYSRARSGSERDPGSRAMAAMAMAMGDHLIMWAI